MKQKLLSVTFVLLSIAVFVLSGFTWLTQQTACYGAQGGVKQTAASGCEYEFQSGSTLDIQAGTTETHANGVTFSGTVTQSGTIVSSGAISQPNNIENIGQLSVFTKAITYTAAAGGSGVVVTVGDGEFWLVKKVLVNVTDDFDTTGDDATLIIGDGGDPDGFIVLADAELQAADTEGTGFAAGWQGQSAATMGAYIDANENGFVYAPSGADETIDYLIDETSGETLTAGAATIYVFYTRFK